MYKMKEVCQRTGLTEKTIRYYVEQKLVQPKVEEGLHYKSYAFDDNDIVQLKTIAVLRSAEFSVADIHKMLEDSNSIPYLVAEKEEKLSAQIIALQSVQRALKEMTFQDRSDVSRVADAIEPMSIRSKETPKSSRNRLLWLCVYAGLFLLPCFLFREICQYIVAAMLLMAGMHFPIMAVGYFIHNRRFRRKSCRAWGCVVSIVTADGFENKWEETTWEQIYGFMNLGFLHWNWIRPDHWIPVIQYESDGELITAVYRYGALKTSWHLGDKLEIAWNPKKEQMIYPCFDRVIDRKAWVYLSFGLICWVGAIFILFVI